MGKRLFEMLVIALLVAGVAGVFLRVVGSVPISVTQTQKQSTFDVTGQGKVAVKPDQAEMSLGVSKESGSVATATEQVDQTMTSLSQELKKMGVDSRDITTTDYSVYPSYSPDSTTNKRYTVTSTVRVVIRDITKAGDVVDLVGKMGLTSSGGLTFTLSDSLKDKTMKEAREKAIAEAKKKAEELASIAGMNVGRIVNIQENTMGYPMPYLMKAEAAQDAVSSRTPAQVEPGTSETTVSVTLSYETR